MKGDNAVIDQLNAVLRLQLTAINQYFLHARMLDNWGLAALGGPVYRQSIIAMKQADRVVQRILLLQGLPNLQDLDKLLLTDNAGEVPGNDLYLERRVRDALAGAVKVCEAQADYVSRHLLRECLTESETHVDWLETQTALIDRMGTRNFLQSAMESAEDA